MMRKKNRWSDRTQSIRVYFWVLSYIKPYKWLFILLVLCGFVLTIGEMSIARYIQYFIDRILPQKSANLYMIASIVITMVLIAMFGAMATQNLVRRHVQEKAFRDLQHAVFRHLYTLGFAYYEEKPVGETLSMMNTDVSALQAIYTDYLPSLINQLFMTAIPLIYLLATNCSLTILIIPCYFLYYIIGPYIDKKSAEYLEKQTKTWQEVTRKIYESVTSVLELRAFGVEQWDFNRMNDKYETFKRTRLTSLWFRHLRFAFRAVSSGIGIVLLYFLAANLVKEHKLTVGEFISFSAYALIVMNGIGRLTILMIEQTYILTQARRLYQFLKKVPNVKESKNPTKIDTVHGRLDFNNVEFFYPTRPTTPVLNGFSLHVQAGDRVALVGTSGNGKSTLLKLVSRFYDPTAGEILLDGIPLEQLPQKQIHEAIGYVFQETYLFGTSIMENIRFGRPDAEDAEVIAAAKSAYAHEFIMQMPHGYDTQVGERGMNLSGGQKQRISIARVFLKNPKIVLLDEATSALDNISELSVQKALDDLLKSRTTLTVAHRLSTIQQYDRIIVLDKGKAAELGKYSELIEQKGLFYLLLEGERKDA